MTTSTPNAPKSPTDDTDLGFSKASGSSGTHAAAAGDAGSIGKLRFRADDPASIVAPEGVPIIVVFVVVSAVIVTLCSWLLGPIAMSASAVVTCVLCLWAIWFFRDPQRRIPVREDGTELVICPADGVISYVGPAEPPPELGMTAAERQGAVRVSVFMNVFNVHVNRSPVKGVVDKKAYTPGKFFNAALDKASEHNERMGLVMKMPDGRRIACVQIAGLVARRIVCRVGEGAALNAGQRFGIIRFGSRVDVYLPAGITPMVKRGDRTVAGETVFAVLASGPAAAGRA